MSEVNSVYPRGVDLPMPVGRDEAKIFKGPSTLSDRIIWREHLHAWRENSLNDMNYDDIKYRHDQLGIACDFNVALVWLWDELLFDFKAQEFTPKKLLDDFKRFGGLDGIILWHAYPVIGLDSRNQFDFYNQVIGLDLLIKEFQLRDVKVFLNYNPWDRWSARGIHSDQEEIALLIKRYNFDGVFLDTMKSVDPDFMEPIYAINPKIVIGGESRVQQERICDHQMSWAQWFADSQIPGVIRAKWFEKRHMLHQTRRWNRSHIDELQIAWINGCGMLIWEVVFGSWVGWNPRETQMWKEMVEVLRRNSLRITDGEWEPLTQLSVKAEEHGIYASKFSLNGNSLITIINKNIKPFEGEILEGCSAKVSGHGVAAIEIDLGDLTVVNFNYDQLSTDFPMRKNRRFNLAQGERETLAITYRNRECGLFEGAPFVEAWKPLPPNYHQIFTKKVEVLLRRGRLDESEVTNAQFYNFMQATNYEPQVQDRFLAHWIDRAPSVGQMNLPVTFVDLQDAHAFARWRGVEIPTEWEWQYNCEPHIKAKIWNLTDSEQTDGRTRFMVLKGGSSFNLRNGQGAKSTSGIAESDWYVDGGEHDSTWVEKILLMGAGMSRSENIGFRCFTPSGGK